MAESEYVGSEDRDPITVEKVAKLQSQLDRGIITQVEFDFALAELPNGGARWSDENVGGNSGGD